jgi:hypothetical protein
MTLVDDATAMIKMLTTAAQEGANRTTTDQRM